MAAKYPDTDLLKSRLKAQAQAHGFDGFGICAPGAVPQVAAGLAGFLAAGYHGQMQWLFDRSDWRSNPQALWPDAQSVIMLTQNYGPQNDPRAILDHPDKGAISVYAQGRDYHDVIKKRLKAIARWLITDAGGAVKVFVDTAPVPEKPLAQAAGLGWQGKHTNLVTRDLGSWVFLGAIFTTLDLPKDTAEVDHCGSCTACLQACPTNAFPAPHQIDARRCISYLTIEHRGPVDPMLRPAMGNRIYGCDDCLAACPWNKFAQTASEIKYHPRADLTAPDLLDLALLHDAAFRARFSGSPIKRIGRDRMVRNALYAIGNSGRADWADAIRPLCDDPDPAVADAAQWALGRLLPGS